MALIALAQRSGAQSRGRAGGCVRAGHLRRRAVLRRRRDHAGDLGARRGRGPGGRRAGAATTASCRSRWLVLLALFVVQRAAPARSARCSGRSCALWFVVLAVLGVWHIVAAPARAAGAEPALRGRVLRSRTAAIAFFALGAVVLCVTGAEALYADMGHFGKRPIRLRLVRLRAAGAGAELLRPGRAAARESGGGRAIRSTCWCRLALLIPMIVLATAAAVIASQAVISGAFSVTRAGDPARLPAAHARACTPRRSDRARSTCRASTGCCCVLIAAGGDRFRLVRATWLRPTASR